MAPKIVKKDQKRREIAMASLEFIQQNGFDAFSTASLIKFMGIGKSSLYHYFDSKEEILFEAFYLVSLDYIQACQKKLNGNMSIEEKLNTVFEFYLIDNDENLWFRGIYLEYLKIFVDAHTDQMKKHNLALFNLYKELIKEILQQEVDKGDLKESSLEFAKSVLMTADGMLIYSYSIEEFDLAYELKNYFTNLLLLLKV